ncbi:MAG: STAS domain-containing protein [Terriglobales bacterium]
MADVIGKNQSQILSSWMQEVPAATRRADLIGDSEFRNECSQFLQALREGARDSETAGDLSRPEWHAMRDLLNQLTRARVQLGFTPTQVATFVFSAKAPIFNTLRQDLGKDPQLLADETYRVSLLLDELGLYTTEIFQRWREEVIRLQQQEMLELSTPVVKLWEGILALPLIGTLDSARTQIVMETLLQKIVETGSSVAIIDITGVPTVDTLVAQHLIKTVTAARLMGADCIISGIRPQIAQTIVHLGVGLGDVTTKASLADAFLIALSRAGLMIQASHAH